jgi:hypothetical protein
LGAKSHKNRRAEGDLSEQKVRAEGDFSPVFQRFLEFLR